MLHCSGKTAETVTMSSSSWQVSSFRSAQCTNTIALRGKKELPIEKNSSYTFAYNTQYSAFKCWWKCLHYLGNFLVIGGQGRHILTGLLNYSLVLGILNWPHVGVHFYCLKTWSYSESYLCPAQLSLPASMDLPHSVIDNLTLILSSNQLRRPSLQ